MDAGAYHTVGLKSDGTVVAAGRNDEGQCEVSGWTNVTAVACTDYNTLALLGDGTVVSAGYQDFAALEGWKDMTFIGGGSYLALGLRKGGGLLCTHLSGLLEDFTELVAADCSTGYALGLKKDGTVLCSFLDLSDWTQVAAISASGTAVYGLTAEGTILTKAFRPGDTLDFSDITAAVAIASNGTHAAAVLANGQVIARGDNGCGQLDTGAWDLGDFVG